MVVNFSRIDPETDERQHNLIEIDVSEEERNIILSFIPPEYLKTRVNIYIQYGYRDKVPRFYSMLKDLTIPFEWLKDNVPGMYDEVTLAIAEEVL
jgi:hypothetical protein